MFCNRTAILFVMIALAAPAAAEPPRNALTASASADRWVQQLANDVDHLQKDIYFERGRNPDRFPERVDHVAHFQTLQAEGVDPQHLQHDFQEMDKEIHDLVKILESADDSWVRRQASRIHYSDEQLHYSLQLRTPNPDAPSLELLARQSHLLESAARDSRDLAARVNRREGDLDKVIREFANDAEYFHKVVEKGADAHHFHKDFQEVDDSWHEVVQLLNQSSYIYYLRSKAEDVNRVRGSGMQA